MLFVAKNQGAGVSVPLLLRGEFILGLDLGRGELVEELLAELEEIVGRGGGGLGGRRRGRLGNEQRGREGER